MNDHTNLMVFMLLGLGMLVVFMIIGYFVAKVEKKKRDILRK